MTRIGPSRRLVFAVIASATLSGCNHHPVDCAIGFAWADCLPGTAGYTQRDPVLYHDPIVVQDDDALCKSYGLTFGTADYAKCRQDFLAQRNGVKAP